MSTTTTQAPTGYDWLLSTYEKHTATLCKKIAAFKIRSQIDACMTAIFHRMTGSLKSIRLLEIHSGHYHLPDTASILRAMYDLHLQCLYLLTDPPKHAKDYIDYMKIKKYELWQKAALRPKYNAQLESVPEFRTKVLPTLRDEYDAVKQRFLIRGKNSCRRNWYVGNLETLAGTVGPEYLDEYKLIQGILSAAVHSEPGMLLTGLFPLPPHIVVHHAWVFTQRVAGGIAEYRKISLDEGEKVILAEARKLVTDPLGT